LHIIINGINNNTIIINLLRLQQPSCVRGRRRKHVVINWHFILRDGWRLRGYANSVE